MFENKKKVRSKRENHELTSSSSSSTADGLAAGLVYKLKGFIWRKIY
jgi:hypothetical protein